jgi:hypothetical protein
MQGFSSKPLFARSHGRLRRAPPTGPILDPRPPAILDPADCPRLKCSATRFSPHSRAILEAPQNKRLESSASHHHLIRTLEFEHKRNVFSSNLVTWPRSPVTGRSGPRSRPHARLTISTTAGACSRLRPTTPGPLPLPITLPVSPAARQGLITYRSEALPGPTVRRSSLLIRPVTYRPSNHVTSPMIF